jgi:hypothetical protein
MDGEKPVTVSITTAEGRSFEVVTLTFKRPLVRDHPELDVYDEIHFYGPPEG